MNDCPDYVTALLDFIRGEMERHYWNKYQEDWDVDYGDPFSNSGNVVGFDNGTFEVHAYDWNDEQSYPYNFKCGEIEISWYKYMGKGMTINKRSDAYELIEMFDKCINSLNEGWNNKLESEPDVSNTKL